MNAVTSRIVCQFSCGAASAVATKIAVAQYSATHDVQIIERERAHVRAVQMATQHRIDGTKEVA